MWCLGERDAFVLRWADLQEAAMGFVFNVENHEFSCGHSESEISKWRCHIGSWIFEPGVPGRGQG